MDCPGSQNPFTPGTLSRDGEVAQCPACGGNYYVTDGNVLEPHPVTATKPIPAQIADLLAEIEERQQRVQQLRAIEQRRVDAACRENLDRAARAAGLT